MASDDGLEQLATLLTKLDQRANDVGEAIRLLRDVIPDLERRLDDLAVRMQPFLEASEPFDDVQTRLQKAADAIQARADTLDVWMQSAAGRLEESLQERHRLLEQRADSLFQAMNQRVDDLVRSVEAVCASLKDQASKFDELEKAATEDVRRVVEAASRRDDEIALRLGNLASDLERALEEVRLRSEESLRNVKALSVKVGKQTDSLASGVAVAAEAAADRLRRDAETAAIQVAEDIRRRLIDEIGRLRDEALADLEGRTAETMGRLREDLSQFENRWQRDFTELLVQLQGTTTVLSANEEELTWVEQMVRRFLRWIAKLK